MERSSEKYPLEQLWLLKCNRSEASDLSLFQLREYLPAGADACFISMANCTVGFNRIHDKHCETRRKVIRLSTVDRRRLDGDCIHYFPPATRSARTTSSSSQAACPTDIRRLATQLHCLLKATKHFRVISPGQLDSPRTLSSSLLAAWSSTAGRRGPLSTSESRPTHSGPQRGSIGAPPPAGGRLIRAHNSTPSMFSCSSSILYTSRVTRGRVLICGVPAGRGTTKNQLH